MLNRIWQGWKVVAKKIGHVQSVILLTLIYFVAAAPFALIVRFFADPLAIRRAGSWHAFTGATGAMTTVEAARRQA